MRFSPARLFRSEFLNTLLLADYLLKFFTVGQEVQGSAENRLRPIQKLIEHLPIHLRKIIEDFHAVQQKESLHRFWIEALETSTAVSENGNILQAVVSDLTMIVKKHLMAVNTKGELVDADEGEEGWLFYVFESEQAARLAVKNNQLQSPAIIFIENSNTVYFFENALLSCAFPIVDYERTLDKVYQQPKDSNNKIPRNAHNSDLLYRATLEVTSQTEKFHYFSPEYIFSQEFTAHYDEFAQYFPEFGRLKALSKVSVFIGIMNRIRGHNKEKINGLESLLTDDNHPYWQSYREEIETIIQKARKEYQVKYKSESQRMFDQLSKDFSRLQKSSS